MNKGKILSSVKMVVLFGFLLPAAPALAASGTTAGAIQVQPADRSLVVTAPYTGDANGSNSLKLEWDENGGDWATLLGSATLPHAANPYAYRISGLTNGSSYQIRLTWQDADGVSGTATQVSIDQVPYNPRVHSSLSTNSSKWGGSWGIPGGKYGEFTCGTCHDRATGNIKRVRNALPSAPSTASGNFPGAGGAVSFQDVRNGTSDFGDDSRAVKTSSTKICEVCHTYDAAKANGVNKHAYNMPADAGHYNKSDCTPCHKHNEGFKASGCNGCHGDTSVGNFWPDLASEDPANYPDRAGRHVEHVNAIGDTINGGGPGSATLTDKNATCVYCHPNPGGANVNGASHDANTTGSLAKSPDTHNDGFNPGTDFLNMQGGIDGDGSYNPNIGRCSTADCHSNGEFTWTWYTDILPPAQITNLAGATGTDVGSVDLTWTAPANDGNAGPNAYQYEVRYDTAPITNANWASATIAGGPPSVHHRGNSQKMTVYGLTPGNSYHFAVKTADEAYNWSSASNSTSKAARTDSQAPIFWGLGNAVATDETGTVTLSWDAAQDHSQPITYTVYYDVGTIDYGGNDQVSTTTGTTFVVSGLPTGVLYNFAVRATDSATVPNTDTNTVIRQALPKTVLKLPAAIANYYTNGTTILQTTGYGTANSSALAGGASRTWAATAYGVDTNVYGTSFYARFTNGNENLAGQATAELGYLTGSVWNRFVPAVTSIKSIPPNSNKVQRFGFGGGGKVPAGSKLAVRVTNSGTLSYTLATGSATNRGDIAVSEQLYNHLPTPVTFNPQPSGSGIVTITWTASTDQDGHSVHYEVYGSDDGGLTYKHIIARDLAGTTTSVQWNTVAAGIGLKAANPNVRVKVVAMDGYLNGDRSSYHTPTVSNAWTVDNTIDTIAPGQITNLVAETRPRTGSVYLTWTSPGDDAYEKTRAAQYDIRYNTVPVTESNWATSTQVTSEPMPDFGGKEQGFEVLGLTPRITYHFAAKAADERPNWSPLSNSATASGGERCGICHSTPPDDAATAGNHIDHGYTVNDCAKCHGDQVLAYTNTDYNLTASKHQDGLLQLGFGRNADGTLLTPVAATLAGANGEIVTYWQDPDGAAGPAPAYKIYEDNNGAGGVNISSWVGSDKKDNGSCFNFANVNATGCHGPATPSWDESVTLPCAGCHGDNTRTLDPYGRAYDSSSVRVKASPPVDNSGNRGLPSDPVAKRKYVGQHEKHLNYSFRYAKGDSCRLCHKDNKHADRKVDVIYDLDGAGAGALFTPNAGGPGTPGSCGGTSGLSCHGTATPLWDSAQNIDCVNCHQFGGIVPNHVTDPAGAGFVNDGKGNCEWCHVAGHPKGATPGTVLIPNNVVVGIYYSSGGIHLKNNIGGRVAASSEAEVCWSCHDSQTPKISEWGTNTRVNTGSSPYNYGTLSTSNWTTATWASGTAGFSYKSGAIRSTHSTSPAGTSAVARNTTVTPNRYEEAVDTVGNLRCSNCHDVHNRNLAPGDTVSGSPYLRGTWMGNPYPEDGAPQAGTTYTAYTKNITHTYAASTIGFGQVPRGGIDYKQQGGYFIDENSGYPTKGWTLGSSAGLCTLCHGDNVDEMNQQVDEDPGTAGVQGLWLGTNGHSNSVLGGTGLHAANIFDYTHGRPVPSNNTTLATESFANRVPDMANQRAAAVVGDQYFTYGYRLPTWNPRVNALNNEPLDNLAYDWGTTVDATTIDKNYHQFSCSKCHNPHASRLPKLMITNCLDIRHNTWDDNKNSQTRSTASTTDYNKKPAYYASAQNCHRRDDSRTGVEKGGWNHVTPW